MLQFRVYLSDEYQQKYNSSKAEVEEILKKTATSAFYITQYFNPDFWNENQYNGYIN